MRKIGHLILAGMLMVTVAGGQAAEAAGTSCLTLSGTAFLGPLEVDVGEPIQLTYKLTPGGSYSDSISRNPLHMIMLLDKSGSMNNTDGRNTQSRMAILKSSSKNLIDQLSALQLNDKIGLVQFGDTAANLAGITNDYTSLKKKIDSLTPGGGTNIEHALRTATTMLTGVNQPYVVLVTDGYATNYYDDKKNKSIQNEQQARNMALTAANQLAAMKVPVYTIALGAVGGSDVDHNLLSAIASKTSGKAYNASNSTELNQVFANIKQEITKQGTIKTITIRQPLPNGFELADNEAPGAYIEQVNGINTLIIPTDDIQYPYTAASRTVTVNIKQNNPGQYNMGSSVVSYMVPCNTEIINSPISMNTSINVLDKLTVRDMYGNTYEGNRHGDVTRYRLGDEEVPQWTIPGRGTNQEYRVTGISFSDSVHTKIHVDFTATSNQKGTADWNLLPTVPSSFKDANGSTIKDAGGSAIKDTLWHKGPATINSKGSTIQLPSSTIYKNTDFTTSYMAYQYRVTSENGVLMRDWSLITPATQLTESDPSMKVEVRAATAAITSNANRLLGGPATSTIVSLDFLPPEVPIVTADFTKDKQTYLYTITRISDADSGVAEARLLKSGEVVNSEVTENTTFAATEMDISEGKYTIEVKDNAGFETVKTVTELPEDTSPPVIDPGNNGPTAFIANNDRSFAIKVSDPESYVYNTTITIDGGKPYTPKPQKVEHELTYNFKLSDIIDTSQERIGWHQIIITSTNVKGLIERKDDYFLINPGPTSGSLTSNGDYISEYSDAPVVITAAFNPEVVAEARFTRLDGTTFIGKAVTIKSMSYAIMQNNSKPSISQFKALGSYKFRVDKEGNNRVYLRLVDSLGMDNIDNGSVIPQVTVNIDYKQKRY